MATTRRVSDSSAASKRWYATGRRKEATARVYISQGTGTITVNNRALAEYLRRPTLEMVVNEPFGVIEQLGQFDVKVTVAGGGLAGAGPGGAAMSAWLHLVLLAAWLAAAIALLAVLMAWLGRPDAE